MPWKDRQDSTNSASMSQGLASPKLTQDEVVALHAALGTIREILKERTVSLTPSQRKKLLKMGEKSRNFCQQAVAGLQANEASLPRDFEMAALADDLEDFNALATFYAEYETTGEAIDDTLKALSSDVMVNTLAGVGILKALNKLKPSLDRLLADLGSIRRSKPKKAQDAQA
jgi:DNA-binding MarR family transcriptional regulator